MGQLIVLHATTWGDTYRGAQLALLDEDRDCCAVIFPRGKALRASFSGPGEMRGADVDERPGQHKYRTVPSAFNHGER